jgi:hypothetical protein
MADPICEDGGMMVGARERIPEDPAERYTSDKGIVGCNRIFCDRCSVWVKNIAGRKLDVSTMSRDDLRALYDAVAGGSGASSPLLTPTLAELARFYVCRCGWDWTNGIKWLSDSERDGWHCAGHPAS